MGAASKPVRVQLDENQTQATVRIDGISRPIIAPVLGVEPANTSEPQRIYLASRIHDGQPHKYTGWDLTGAVSTIMTRLPSAADGDQS